MRVERFVKGLECNFDELSANDRVAVESVAALVSQLEKARANLAEFGAFLVDDDGNVKENPAARTERAASAEIRGWVKERPDLFGADAGKARRPRREKFEGFRAV